MDAEVNNNTTSVEDSLEAEFNCLEYWENKLVLSLLSLPDDRLCYSRFLINQANLLKNILCNENYSSTMFAVNRTSSSSTEVSLTLELAQYIFDIAVYIVNNIQIHNFVGIQPILDTGIIHFLGYTFNDEDKVSLDIHSQAVEAGTRKFELDITKSVSDIGTEILNILEADIINDLLHVASTLMPVESFSNFPIYINKAANEIARNTRRGCGNVVLLSTDIFKKMMEECAPVMKCLLDTSNVVLSNTASSIKFEGILNRTINVYSTSQIPTQSVIVGYKGGGANKPMLIDNNETYQSEMNAGMFLCPYTLGKTIDGKLALMYGKAAQTSMIHSFTDDTYKIRNSGNFYVKLLIE